VFGLVSVPSQSAYNAAKFAVRGFTDALRMELEIEKSPISATTVHPGGVRTNIARNARMDDSVLELTSRASRSPDEFDRVARTSPEKAAKQILQAVVDNKPRVLVGADAKLIDVIAKFPALYRLGVVRGGRLIR
jgi:short-subunit dehydrogenase